LYNNKQHKQTFLIDESPAEKRGFFIAKILRGKDDNYQ